MNPGDHWENAKVVAGVPDGKIKTVSVQDLIDIGFMT
jgi:hypothetical protein